MRGFNRKCKGMPWPKTGATYYHAHFGLPDKGRPIKGLFFFCNSWDVRALGLTIKVCPYVVINCLPRVKGTLYFIRLSICLSVMLYLPVES